MLVGGGASLPCFLEVGGGCAARSESERKVGGSPEITQGGLGNTYSSLYVVSGLRNETTKLYEGKKFPNVRKGLREGDEVMFKKRCWSTRPRVGLWWKGLG